MATHGYPWLPDGYPMATRWLPAHSGVPGLKSQTSTFDRNQTKSQLAVAIFFRLWGMSGSGSLQTAKSGEARQGEPVTTGGRALQSRRNPRCGAGASGVLLDPARSAAV
jgi:hypothetical protein